LPSLTTSFDITKKFELKSGTKLAMMKYVRPQPKSPPLYLAMWLLYVAVLWYCFVNVFCVYCVSTWLSMPTQAPRKNRDRIMKRSEEKPLPSNWMGWRSISRVCGSWLVLALSDFASCYSFSLSVFVVLDSGFLFGVSSLADDGRFSVLLSGPLLASGLGAADGSVDALVSLLLSGDFTLSPSAAAGGSFSPASTFAISCSSSYWTFKPLHSV